MRLETRKKLNLAMTGRPNWRKGKITDPKERVEKFVKKTNYCWEWTGSKNHYGYGLITYYNKKGQKKWLRAHRVMYELKVGEIPVGMSVCHHCDNPPCVNPKHLFLGTAKDNAEDRGAKGRHLVGENSPVALLTQKQAEKIRRLKKSGLLQKGKTIFSIRYGD